MHNFRRSKAKIRKTLGQNFNEKNTNYCYTVKQWKFDFLSLWFVLYYEI